MKRKAKKRKAVKEFRDVIVYRPVKTHMKNVKRGDIFKMVPVDKTDLTCPTHMLVAKNNATMQNEPQKGTYGVDCVKLTEGHL